MNGKIGPKDSPIDANALATLIAPSMSGANTGPLNDCTIFSNSPFSWPNFAEMVSKPFAASLENAPIEFLEMSRDSVKIFIP